MHSEIELTREVEAIQIPSGDTVVLPAGVKVIITQSLGGSYTVATEQGLARISARNADALGIEKKDGAGGNREDVLTGPELEAAIWEQLKGVFDPEIPVNIVELGLVYEVKVTPLPDGGRKIDVQMTLTAPGCGMGETLVGDVERVLMQIPTVTEADAQLVFDPPWNATMMSDVAKLETGML